MDIALLSKMVGSLIVGNNQVGLPGIGTFIVEKVPATFSDRGFTINPPYRRLSFVPALSDDTLLVDLYAISNKVNSREAESIIGEFLDKLVNNLKKDSSVEFPGLGVMKMTRQGNILFFCDEKPEAFPDSIGLKPVSLKFHSDNPTTSKVAEPEPESEHIAEPAVEPAYEPVSEPAVEPVSESVAEPEPVTEPQPATDIEARPEKKSGWVGKLFIILLLVAVVAVAAFFALAKLAPDFLDSLLYTPEELYIINY